jgi:multicomponent Na+:H+ antiporter subunit F
LPEKEESVMVEVYEYLAVFLLLTVIVGLVRILRGPTRPDRMLAAQLLGTTGVGVLLLLSHAWHAPVLLDVALVFALLAAVTAIAFVRRLWIPSQTE